MKVLKFFWNLMAGIAIVIILVFAGYGGYKLYESIQTKDITPFQTQTINIVEENSTKISN